MPDLRFYEKRHSLNSRDMELIRKREAKAAEDAEKARDKRRKDAARGLALPLQEGEDS